MRHRMPQQIELTLGCSSISSSYFCLQLSASALYNFVLRIFLSSKPDGLGEAGGCFPSATTSPTQDSLKPHLVAEGPFEVV